MMQLSSVPNELIAKPFVGKGFLLTRFLKEIRRVVDASEGGDDGERREKWGANEPLE